MINVAAIRMKQFGVQFYQASLSAKDIDKLVRFEVLSYGEQAQGVRGNRKKAAVHPSKVNWDLLERRLGDGRTWGAGETFTLADCAAAPILTYARRLVPFGDRPRLRAWHGRLMARPSFRRALEDAAPFGDLMPAPPAAD